MRKGFSLLEILLVLGIMTLFFFPLLSMISSGLSVSEEIEKTTTGLQLAQEKIETIKDLPFGSITFEARSAVAGFPGYEREVVVSSPETDLKQIEVKVYWLIRGLPADISLNTFVVNL